MYTPSHFNEDRLDVLQALVAAHPLGTLVTHSEAGLDADHIPFELAAPTPDALLRGTPRTACPPIAASSFE